MIRTQMRNYNYLTFGANDTYGQPQLIGANDTVQMSINFASESIQENPLYSGAQYTGLTFDKRIDATFVIQYGDEKLKVLYVNSVGRYRQVFMARM